MAVEINVDLDSTKAHGKIEALETRLKLMGDSVDIDFGIDDGLKDSIQQITEELKEINIDVDYDDLERAAALKSMLQGDIETDLNVDMDKALSEYKDGLDPPDTGGGQPRNDDGTFASPDSTSQSLENMMERLRNFPGTPDAESDDEWFSQHGRMMDYKGMLYRGRNANYEVSKPNTVKLKDGIGNALALKQKLDQTSYMNKGTPENLKSFSRPRTLRTQDLLNEKWNSRKTLDFDTDLEVGDFRKFNLPKDVPMDYDGSIFKGMKKKFRSLIPSMNTFYTLFAAILPLLVVLGTQLLGVAAAMGAVALAGGSIIALGLLGHGEDMASSWKKAKEQLSDLKEEMFEVFQPTMQTFAPIQARFFDVLPEELNKVAAAMESLTVYSDTLFAAMSGVTDWIAGGIRGMSKYESVISQLAMRFGELLGTNINDFFRWLIVEAYESQEMLVSLGSAFKDLLVGAYQLSKLIARIVVALAPLTGLFAWLGRLLNNKLIVGVLTFVTVLGLVVYTVMTLTGVMAGLIGLWGGGLIATILSSVAALEVWIFQTLAAQMANYGLAASIATVVSWATLGVGALVAMGAAASAIGSINSQMEMTTSGIGGVGGMPAGGGYGSGGAGSGTTQNIVDHGDTYNLNVKGDVDNPTKEGLADMMTSEGNISDARDWPAPGDDE